MYHSIWCWLVTRISLWITSLIGMLSFESKWLEHEWSDQLWLGLRTSLNYVSYAFRQFKTGRNISNTDYYTIFIWNRGCLQHKCCVQTLYVWRAPQNLTASIILNKLANNQRQLCFPSPCQVTIETIESFSQFLPNHTSFLSPMGHKMARSLEYIFFGKSTAPSK